MCISKPYIFRVILLFFVFAFLSFRECISRLSLFQASWQPTNSPNTFAVFFSIHVRRLGLKSMWSSNHLQNVHWEEYHAVYKLASLAQPCFVNDHILPSYTPPPPLNTFIFKNLCCLSPVDPIITLSFVDTRRCRPPGKLVTCHLSLLSAVLYF